MGVRAFKYIHKYVYKGGDRASLAVGEEDANDEIKQHLDGRYVGSEEGCLRLGRTPMHDEKPPNQRLQVHEPGKEFITFDSDDNPIEVAQRARKATSTLTGFFKAIKKRKIQKSILECDVGMHVICYIRNSLKSSAGI